MRLSINCKCLFFVAVILSCNNNAGKNLSNSSIDPPFAGGTIYIEPNIITSTDPTTFQDITPKGQDYREMYDFRVDAFINNNAYLFDVNFKDGLSLEIQVNSEFENQTKSLLTAEKFAKEIGRLPTDLRRGVKTVWIHKGVCDFGGGNNNILIHVGKAAVFEKAGFLEEALFHEGCHASLDPVHESSPKWLAAQIADGVFISDHAQKNPKEGECKLKSV